MRNSDGLPLYKVLACWHAKFEGAISSVSLGYAGSRAFRSFCWSITSMSPAYISILLCSINASMSCSTTRDNLDFIAPKLELVPYSHPLAVYFDSDDVTAFTGWSWCWNLCRLIWQLHRLHTVAGSCWVFLRNAEWLHRSPQPSDSLSVS